MHLAIAIPIDPRPWSVGRILKLGKHMSLQKADVLTEYQHAIYHCVRRAVPETFREFDGVLRLDIVAVFARPKRLMRAKDPDGFILHDRRPDRDNLAKAVQDAIGSPPEGSPLLLKDDARVVVGETLKVYAEKGGAACVLVVLDTEIGTATEELERMGVLSILSAR